MNKSFKAVIILLFTIVFFISGAAAGGAYVLRELSITQNDTSYIVEYDGHLFKYEKED